MTGSGIKHKENESIHTYSTAQYENKRKVRRTGAEDRWVLEQKEKQHGRSEQWSSELKYMLEDRERKANEKTSLIKQWWISKEDNDVGVGEHERKRRLA